MLKLFSESTQYAIQAMIHLSVNPEKRTMVSIIAEKENIPSQYLGKIAQILSKHGLIKTTRGRSGGLILSCPPEDIKILDIVLAINGPYPDPEMCVFGLDFCVDSAPCPVHKEWKGLKEDIKKKLMNQNLRSLANELKKKHAMMRLE